MADVNISKYRASVVRDGSKPSSPGFVVSEGQDPVNPPGTNNFVPYTGATANVELGEFGVEAGFVTLDTTPTNIPTDQGAIYWDDTRSTAALIMNGTLQHIGQDSFFYVKNSSGSTIPKGTCVGFAGTDGGSGHLLITPFLANGSVPSTYFMGVTCESIANGSFGQVMHFGELTGINTSGFTAGALLYASTTVAGGFQTTVPVAPNNIVLVAAAVNSKNNGAIVVRPTLGSNINSDEGVKITSPTTGDLLQLQAGGLWENKTLAQVIGSAYVPSTRTITINGTTQDLSANRTFNVGTVTSVGLSSATSGVTIGSTPVTSSGTITLAIATATATQNGLLSSTDWSTFNNKQNALTNPVTGTGTTNYLAKFTGSTTVGNSQVFDNGTNVGIGTASPTEKLDVIGVLRNLMPSDPLSGMITAKFLSFSPNPYGIHFRGYSSGVHSIQSQKEGNDAQIFGLSLQPLGGNVLIGTTSDNGARLQVNGSVTAARFISSTSSSYTNDFLNLNIGTVGQSIGLRFGYDGSTYNKGAIYFVSRDSAGRGNMQFALDPSASSSNVSTSNAIMTLNYEGNLGLGVTPSAWGSSAYGGTTRVIEIGELGSSIGAGAGALIIGNNWYSTNSAAIYSRTGFRATYYAQNTALGEHQWYNAPSGTAGNAISFTQAMTLTSGGYLLLGGTSSAYGQAGRGTFEMNGSADNIFAMRVGGSLTGYLYTNASSMEIYSTNKLDISTNGAVRATITTGGNLLVGTTTDNGARLQVNGSIRSGFANTSALLVQSNGTATTGAAIAIQQLTPEGDTIIFGDYEPYAEYGIIARNSLDSIDFTGGTTNGSLDNYNITNRSGNIRTAYVKARIGLASGVTAFGGNVGIGTSSPVARLEVGGNIGGGGILRLNDLASESSIGYRINGSTGSTGWVAGNFNDDFFVYSYTLAAQALTIKPSGNVGIRTTSPSYKLHINTSGTAENVLGITNGTQTLTLGVNNGAGGSFLFENTNNALRFGTNDTERFRISATGFVSAGATTNGRLGVRGFTNDSSGYAFEAANASGNSLFLVRNDGFVGINTVPQKAFEALSSINDFVSVGVNSLGVGQWTGIHFGYRENNTSYRKSAIVFERTDLTASDAQGKIHILNGPQASAGSATLANARLTIAENGNVGIGTTSPLQKLHITQAADTAYPTLGTGKGALFISGDTNLYGLYVGINTNDGNTYFQAMRNNSATAYNITMQAAGGNVLIGTTTDNGAKLNVNGTIRTANPTGSTSDGWLLGRALVSGSSTPDRWIRVQIGNLYYDILARYIGSV